MVHRVKNTLSLVQSLAHNTLKGLIPAADFSTFEGRLMSIAKAQEMIAETGAVVDLATLLTSAIRPVAQSQWRRVHFDGPTVAIAGDDATSLSMVFHELATNACKYGSLSHGGSIDVTWEVTSDGPRSAVSVKWTETGGPAVCAPKRLGFGTKLIDRLVRSLTNARLTRDFAPNGLRVTLGFGVKPFSA